MTPDPRPGTVRCADCDWTVAAVEAVAWRELAAHRAETHDESPYESRESDANHDRMGMQEAAKVVSARLDEKEAYLGAFYAAWPSYRYLPSNVDGTVSAIFEAGLPMPLMEDAASIAGSARGVNDRLAYFAGICWKRVRAMQEIARAVVDAEED